MTGPSAPSSDRLALRALARRLRPPDGPTLRAAPAPVPPPTYVRLTAPAHGSTVPIATMPTTVAPAATPVAPPAPLPPSADELSGSAGWARLLEWCVIDVGVDAAILTDDRGLVIASAGVVDLELAQGIAARLVIAFHQADRMSTGPSRTMVIELDGIWLTGLRIDHSDEPLTLSVLAATPLATETRAALASAIAHKLAT